MYPFSNRRFALLMRTRSSTLNFGTPFYHRDRTSAATPPLDSPRSHVKGPCLCFDDRCRCTTEQNPVARRLIFRKVSPHTRLQRSVEPFDDTRLGLLVMNGEMRDTVLLQQTPHGSVEELQTFVCLQGCRRDVDQQSFQCRHQRRRRLVFQRNAPGPF